MNCTICATELPEGTADCPSCGAVLEPPGTPAALFEAVPVTETVGGSATVAGPAPSAPTSDRPAPSGHGRAGRPAVDIQLSRWDTADRIIGVATFVMLVGLFLPWFGLTIPFGLGRVTVSGLDAHGYLYLALIVAIVLLLDLAARAAFAEMPYRLPIERRLGLRIATGADLVLVVIGFLDKPGGSGVGWSWGAFISLVAAVVAAFPALPGLLRARVVKR